VCDLCGGRPQCVEACTEGALIYDPDGERPSLAAFTKTKKMNASEKRWNYIKIMGWPTREKWRESHG
jgi:ferredoxin